MTPTAHVRWFVLWVYDEHKCSKHLDQPAREQDFFWFVSPSSVNPRLSHGGVGGGGCSSVLNPH